MTRTFFARFWNPDGEFAPLADIERRFAKVAAEFGQGRGTRFGWQLVAVADRDQLQVAKVDSAGFKELGRAPIDQPAAIADVLRSALGDVAGKPSRSVIRLAPSRAVTVKLTLPEAARAQVAPILRNKIERLAPWPASEAAFGYRIEPGAEDGKIDITVAVTSKRDLDRLLDGLRLCGLVPDGVEVAAGDQSLPPVTILDHAPKSIRRASRATAIGYAIILGGIATAAVALLVLDLSASAAIGGLRDRMESATRLNARVSTSADLEGLRERKAKEPAVLAILSRLSEALPDNAWLTNLALADGTITIRGQGHEIPSAMQALQREEMFSSVRFAAPTVRRQDATEEFAIAAEVRSGVRETAP